MMDTNDKTPIDQVEGGMVCATYLCEQLELQDGSIKTYGELGTTLRALRDQLLAEHGETVGTMKYMSHLTDMYTRARNSLG